MTAAYAALLEPPGSEPPELDRADVIAAPDASLTCGTRSRMTSTSHADHAIRQRVARADPLPHAGGKRRGPTGGRRSRRGMRSRASLRLRQLKADRGPAVITHDEPHARATEKRQLIFAVGQSVPHPAAGVRRQGECILDSSRAQLHLRKAQTAVVARCGLQR